MRLLTALCLSGFALAVAGCSIDVDTSTTPTTGNVETQTSPQTLSPPQPDIDPNDPRIAELSALLKKQAEEEEVSQEDAAKISELIRLVLPTQQYIGAGNEWDVSCSGNLISLTLKSSKGTRHMWFHVLYELDDDDSYGSEAFDNYRGMGMEDVHYFALIGHLEIRAVADSDEYKDDAKIKNMIRAFALPAIERL